MENLVKLINSGNIGSIEVKNRIVFAQVWHGFTFGTKPDGFLTEGYWNSLKPEPKVVWVDSVDSGLARPAICFLID